MCGIAGALFRTHRDAAGARDLVARMVAAMAHRGPDGQGMTLCTGTAADADAGVTPSSAVDEGPIAAFGHTRLAILDLSERAAQPMRHGGHWITFNGEIYNFKDLRRELEALGHRFHSDSDTEVILQGYEAWGDRVVDHLRGMFAFAIWDGHRRRLLLARDRAGIKPLYVYEAPGGLMFASEVRALLATGLVPRKIDRAGLEEFLAYQTVPAPRTLVEGVSSIRPGCLAIADRSGAFHEQPYWDWLGDASPAAGSATPVEARSRVRELLDESAALHMVSDVPVGIFLSGGIDSSALVALTRRAGVTPRTFSVVLPGSSQNEAAFAAEVAAHFRADHTEIAISEADARAQLPEALAHVDHPSGDGVNTYLVSRAVRAAGYKVALSGLGGDELFGGYPSFERMSRLASYAPMWKAAPAPVRSAMAFAVRAAGQSSIASSKMAAVLASDGTLPQAFPLLRQLFSREDRAALMGDDGPGSSAAVDPYESLLEAAVAAHPSMPGMTLVSYAEARTYMHDVLLRDTDQMSMAVGLEARVPLLDHRLAEYVMGLPERAKEPDGQPKRLLIESLGEPLPSACVQRPKQGFVLPFQQWMAGELRAFCEAQLHELSSRGCVSASAVASLWAAFLAGDRRTSWSRPWTLVALNAWLGRNGMTA